MSIKHIDVLDLTDVHEDSVTDFDKAHFFTRSASQARAMLRKYTLFFRGIHKDTTKDSITDPTAFYVFVVGKYRHILYRRLWADIVDYKGDYKYTQHKIRAVRVNPQYHTYNVLVDGFPGYKWFYLPRKFYSRNHDHVTEGDLVEIFDNNGTFLITDYTPRIWTENYDSRMRMYYFQ